jgi:hypothetical protein
MACVSRRRRSISSPRKLSDAGIVCGKIRSDRSASTRAPPTCNILRKLAGGLGFEPRLAESDSGLNPSFPPFPGPRVASVLPTPVNQIKPRNSLARIPVKIAVMISGRQQQVITSPRTFFRTAGQSAADLAIINRRCAFGGSWMASPSVSSSRRLATFATIAGLWAIRPLLCASARMPFRLVRERAGPWRATASPGDGQRTLERSAC